MMKSIHSIVRLGESLGRLVVGRVSQREMKGLRRWYRKENNRKLTGSIVSEEEIERRIKFYREYNTTEAYLRFQHRLSGKPASRGNSLRKLAVWSAAAAVVLTVGMTGYLQVQKLKEGKRMMEVIARMEPGMGTAVLYMENEEGMELGDNFSSVIDSVKGISVKDNTLSYRSPEKTGEEEFNTLETPRGGEYRLVLVDGTEVWLNAGSSLKYFVNTGKGERKVYLTGEAYFKVASDQEHPFVVVSGAQVVKVVGTEFNISAYKDDAMIYTTLVRGCVKVNADGREVRMDTCGQQTILNKGGGMAVRQVDPRIFSGWKEGIFMFSYSTLEEIMKKLSRWYDFDYEIQNEILRNTRFSGAFDRFDNLGKVFEVLRSTGVDLKLNYLDDKLIIR